MCLSVGVSKLQVAIFARSSREMYQTVRIDCKYILSRVRVSVRPIIFYTRKTPKLSRIPSRPRVVYLNEAPTGHCLANIEKGGVNSVMDGRTDPSNSDGGGGGCVCARVCACARACVHA